MRLGLLLVLLINNFTDFAVYGSIICLGFTELVNNEMHLLYMRFGFAVVQELVFFIFLSQLLVYFLNDQYFLIHVFGTESCC